MAEELKNAPAAGRLKKKNDGEEDPIVIVQRFLNIFRQLHIFDEKRRHEFDQQILSLSPEVRGMFGLLPGGSLLQEYADDLVAKAETGSISAAGSTTTDILSAAMAEAQGTTAPAQPMASAAGMAIPQIIQTEPGKVVADENFAQTLAQAFAKALQFSDNNKKEDIKELIAAIRESKSAAVNAPTAATSATPSPMTTAAPSAAAATQRVIVDEEFAQVLAKSFAKALQFSDANKKEDIKELISAIRESKKADEAAAPQASAAKISLDDSFAQTLAQSFTQTLERLNVNRQGELQELVYAIRDIKISSSVTAPTATASGTAAPVIDEKFAQTLAQAFAQALEMSNASKKSEMQELIAAIKEIKTLPGEAAVSRSGESIKVIADENFAKTMAQSLSAALSHVNLGKAPDLQELISAIRESRSFQPASTPIGGGEISPQSFNGQLKVLADESFAKTMTQSFTEALSTVSMGNNARMQELIAAIRESKNFQPASTPISGGEVHPQSFKGPLKVTADESLLQSMAQTMTRVLVSTEEKRTQELEKLINVFQSSQNIRAMNAVGGEAITGNIAYNDNLVRDVTSALTSVINNANEIRKDETKQITQAIKEAQNELSKILIQNNTLNNNSSSNSNANNIQINNAPIILPIDEIVGGVVKAQSGLFENIAKQQTEQLSEIISAALRESQQLSSQTIVDAITTFQKENMELLRNLPGKVTEVHIREAMPTAPTTRVYDEEPTTKFDKETETSLEDTAPIEEADFSTAEDFAVPEISEDIHDEEEPEAEAVVLSDKETADKEEGIPDFLKLDEIAEPLEIEASESPTEEIQPKKKKKRKKKKSKGSALLDSVLAEPSDARGFQRQPIPQSAPEGFKELEELNIENEADKLLDQSLFGNENGEAENQDESNFDFSDILADAKNTAEAFETQKKSGEIWEESAEVLDTSDDYEEKLAASLASESEDDEELFENAATLEEESAATEEITLPEEKLEDTQASEEKARSEVKHKRRNSLFDKINTSIKNKKFDLDNYIKSEFEAPKMEEEEISSADWGFTTTEPEIEQTPAHESWELSSETAESAVIDGEEGQDWEWEYEEEPVDETLVQAAGTPAGEEGQDWVWDYEEVPEDEIQGEEGQDWEWEYEEEPAEETVVQASETSAGEEGQDWEWDYEEVYGVFNVYNQDVDTLTQNLLSSTLFIEDINTNNRKQRKSAEKHKILLREELMPEIMIAELRNKDNKSDPYQIKSDI